MSASAGLPPGWTEHVDPNTQKTFYFNASTQETKWERPQVAQAASPQPAQSAGLPAGWAEHVDPGSGKTFYYNAQTGVTAWEKPQAAAQPAAAVPQQAAQSSQQAALPAGWAEHTDPGSGRTFYANAQTGQTAWERPQAQPAAAQQPQQAAASALPPGWAEHVDPGSGKTFYANAQTGQTAWERPQGAQPAAAAPAPAAAAPAPAPAPQRVLEEPLRSISAFLDEAKPVKAQFAQAEELIVGTVIAQHAEALKQTAAQTFEVVSAAGAELLPKAQEQAALSPDTLDRLNTAIQACELKYGCKKSETIPFNLLRAKPGTRLYPNLVDQVKLLCAKTLAELEAREIAAFRAKLLEGGHNPALDTQIADLKATLKQNMSGILQKYGQVLSSPHHRPVYKSVGSNDQKLSVLTWNVMEFPEAGREAGKDPIVEGLSPFCDRVVKDLQREDDLQLLLESLSSEEIISQHCNQVLNVVRDAIETRGVDALVLQELGRDIKRQLEKLCDNRFWHVHFSSGESDTDKCAGITALLSKEEFQEVEGEGVEVQEGKIVRHFAAARRNNFWVASCHVPVSGQVTEKAKQDVCVKVVQKMVQELHGKGRTLVLAGDWGADVKTIHSRVSRDLPYGCSSCSVHADDEACFGIGFPVDGILEIV